MDVLIIGAGNGGSTIGADLTLKGHNVTILKTSNKLHNEHFKKILTNGYHIKYDDGESVHDCELSLVTDDIDASFSKEYDVIIIFIQTNYHDELIKKIAPKLKDGQIILLEPGYLSTAYFMKYCPDKELVICEAESSPIDCRIIEPGCVRRLFKNVRNPIGVYPPDKADYALEKLSAFDYSFVRLDSVAEAALHNPNLIVHTVGAIMSIPRIEYDSRNYSMYREVFTPSVWNLVESLDEEKMNVLGALNLERISYVDACKFRNSVDLSINAKEVFFDYAKNHSPMGPTVSNSRYVTEDVPEGLVMLESLGQVLNIQTPTTTALINIASSCLHIPFRLQGRNVERLGMENVQRCIAHC